MKIGIALIGTGAIAEVHAKAIQECGHTELVAVRSRDIKRAEYLAKKYSAKTYTDYDELLKDPKVDAVDIVGINNMHAELGIKAAKAKKHVLVEKPIDVSVEKAEELIKECKKNNVKLSVISQERFDSATNVIKSAAERGQLGKIFMASMSVKWKRTQQYYDSSEGWRKNRETAGGGVLIVQAIHHLDLLIWLLGDVESVYGRSETKLHNIECEDTVAAILKFRNGTLATVEASSAVKSMMNDRLELHGDKGSVILESDVLTHRIKKWTTGKGRMKDIIQKIKHIHHIKKGRIKNQVEDFAESIINNREPKVKGEDGLKALQVIQAIYKSANLKKEVSLTS
ncbi:MAG TPA: Gfo/Idh/MocA family oxidoreductase [Candidatus Nanoarchaeia archaeon]|nr:Gfo/Idh/MocA family oxidoreductase [Candidatus Nanoarchaeia archaeon]